MSTLVGMVLVTPLTSWQSSTSSVVALIAWQRPALVGDGITPTSAFSVEKWKSQASIHLLHPLKTGQKPGAN